MKNRKIEYIIERRLKESPHRKVISIDIGSMSIHDAEKYMEKVKGNLTRPRSRFYGFFDFLGIFGSFGGFNHL